MANDQAPIDWDGPAPTYIEVEEARAKRAEQFPGVPEWQAKRLAISGHSMYLEIMSAAVEGDEIQMACRWHGQVQRPGMIARPIEGGVVQIRLKARVEQPAQPEQEPEPETTADRIQHRSDLR